MNKMTVKKIIWAVDAFEEKTELHRQAAQVLSYCQQNSSVEIEPVFVLSLSEFAFPYSAGPEWIPQAQQSAERNLRYLVSQYKISCLQEPKVLVRLTQSISEAVTILSDYAKTSGADLILVRSHGRKGLQRFFMGSFAENILTRSEVPVMVIGAQSAPSGQIKHILYPTDFRDHSKTIFRSVLDFAKQMGAKITLFHAVPEPDEPFLDFDYHARLYRLQGEYVSLQSVFKHEIQHQEKRARAWCRWAQHEGIEADYVVDSSGAPVHQLIVQAAQQSQANLIMMEAKTGSLQAAFLGSHTRKVLRAAPCPVFVFTKDYYQSHFIEPQKHVADTVSFEDKHASP